MDNREKLKALSDLLTHPGWQLFKEHIAAISQSHQLKTFSAKDAHEMAQNVGAYNATKNLGEWALNNAMQYQSQALASKNQK